MSRPGVETHSVAIVAPSLDESLLRDAGRCLFSPAYQNPAEVELLPTILSAVRILVKVADEPAVSAHVPHPTNCEDDCKRHPGIQPLASVRVGGAVADPTPH